MWKSGRMEPVFLGFGIGSLKGLRLGSVHSGDVCAGTGVELYYMKGKKAIKVRWKC